MSPYASPSRSSALDAKAQNERKDDRSSTSRDTLVFFGSDIGSERLADRQRSSRAQLALVFLMKSNGEREPLSHLKRDGKKQAASSQEGS